MQLEGLVIPISFNTAMLSKGVDMITDLIGNAVSATFDWAEGMDKLGDATGMNAEQTAAWSFIAQKAGVSVDTLANSTVILQKGLFDSKGELSTTGKALEEFGVSVRDSSGNVKDQSTLMNDIAAKYATFGTQTERVDFLTNIFGRSGAQLVDVFDTLAQEGGIDAVEQKVKNLGLAIDPNRYEQFNRNLEELKLAGTGLAIQLTEALMPALESMLTWAQQFQGMTPEQIFQRMVEIIAGLPEKFSEWAKSINWELVSQDLINGINSIDWNAIGQWVGTSAQLIADGLITIFSGIDWAGVFGAIGTAFMEFATGLVGGDFESFKAVWTANWEQLKTIATTLMDMMKTNFQNALNNIKTAFTNAFNSIKNTISNSISGAVNDAIAALESLGNAVISAVGGGVASVPGNASGGYAGGMTWVGENGPELVSLPSGSYVNHNQASNRMSNQPTQAYIDYDELGRVLARVLGQQMQRGTA